MFVKICENCAEEHIGEYGSGRFCSVKCSRSFSTKEKRDVINKSVSVSLKGRGNSSIDKECNFCKSKFTTTWKKRNQLYCSLKCKYESQIIRENKLCPICKKNYTHNKRACSRECLSRDPEFNRVISSNNKGGRCKWIEYKKKNGDIIKLQGTYELRFAKILDEIDINWIKPTIWNREHQFNWLDKKGKSHWYTPDFFSPLLNRYFETKGYWTNLQLEKKEFIETLSNVSIIYNKDILKIENNICSLLYLIRT